ncbi:MAG TPA: protein kinase [Polyangiaceae bacterium]
MVLPPSASIRVVGRYALHQPIASGGMATVHLGRLLGPAGFSRTVAIKRLHAQFATDPEFVSMFLDEARLAARIRSPHVVPIVDIVADGGELLLVMDYVQGEALVRILRAVLHDGGQVPLDVVVAVMSGALHGLHAAHEATDEQGHALGIVHRDVSPQNILVGTDGLARILDFGVAKAAGRIQTTREGQIKGKLAYMAPEQLRSEEVTRGTDVYSAAVVLWEALTCRRLFRADNEGAVVTGILQGNIEAPSRVAPREGAAEQATLETIDAVVLRGLDRDATKRFETARDMAIALEACLLPATAAAVGDWVRAVAGEGLAVRARQVVEMESGVSSVDVLPVPAERAKAGFQPAVTQASSISVSRDTARPGGTSPRKLAIAGGALFASVVLAAFAGRMLARDRVAPAAAPGSDTPVSASGSGQPTAIAADPATASPAATPSEEPTSSAASPHVDRSPPTRRAPPAAVHPAPTGTKDCNPPYYWDAAGKKHYKMSCL